MGNIKAIETEYNGYRFRSRLEARWAVFFDAMGEAYQYEHEGFTFSVDGKLFHYLPDFWLPRFYNWLEIKGQFNYIDAERTMAFVNTLMKEAGEREKYAALSILMNINNEPFNTYDEPDQHGMVMDWGKGVLGGNARAEFWAECPLCARLAKTCACDHCASHGYWFINCPDCLGRVVRIKVKRDKVDPTGTKKILAAYTAARSARFERSETPKVPRGRPKR